MVLLPSASPSFSVKSETQARNQQYSGGREGPRVAVGPADHSGCLLIVGRRTPAHMEMLRLRREGLKTARLSEDWQPMGFWFFWARKAYPGAKALCRDYKFPVVHRRMKGAGCMWTEVFSPEPIVCKGDCKNRCRLECFDVADRQPCFGWDARRRTYQSVRVARIYPVGFF